MSYETSSIGGTEKQNIWAFFNISQQPSIQTNSVILVKGQPSEITFMFPVNFTHCTGFFLKGLLHIQFLLSLNRIIDT